jgi:site-specific DNA recombinase
MTSKPAKRVRCAVYTRVSTEYGLDQEFNSLDAQHEAAEAYVRSQAHDGWTLIRTRYDDGGYSGGSTERPALQRLLADIRDRRIDIVVVYKVDRLTRSLADFAKLVELFDAHGVSFVSVTQQFNTTTSMGRLTLNVLLSFAQFEREVTGERIRDKIGASKRRGLWVGGMVPLGYVSRDKKLVIEEDEAERVRTMFRLYLECGSVGALAEELARQNIVSKVRSFATGRTKGGGPYSVGALAHFLKNRFYIGEVVYRGETHTGEHASIMDRPTFDAVQVKLAENARARRVCVESSPAILMGRIFDDRGNRMTPSHSNKDGVRYRYYVSHVLLQRRKKDAGRVTRVPAIQLEKLVVKVIRAEAQPDTEPKGDLSDRAVIDRCVTRIIVRPDSIDIELREPTVVPAPSLDGPESAGAAASSTCTRVISLPWSVPAFTSVKGVLHQPEAKPTLKQEAQDVILLAIAKARSWIDDLVSGRVQSFDEIAEREGKVERHIRLLTPLAFIPPRTLAAIVAGTGPRDANVTALAQAISMGAQSCRPNFRASARRRPLMVVRGS